MSCNSLSKCGLDLHTSNSLQRELQKQADIYNKATKEYATCKSSDRLNLSDASEALEASKKFDKTSKLNEISLSNVRSTLAKMDASLAKAMELENIAANPQTSLSNLHDKVAAFVSDTVATNAALNTASTETLTTYSGTLGSVIDSTGTVTVGTTVLDTLATGTYEPLGGAGVITSAASLTAANFASIDGAGTAVTAAQHTVALNTLIGAIKDAINTAVAAENLLVMHIHTNEIDKDNKAAQAEVYHSVDLTDLCRQRETSCATMNKIGAQLSC
jgi:hypothetical protein